MNAWVRVRSAGSWFAVPVAAIERICEVGAALPAPARDPAVRGVVAVADRLVPVAHLAALLSARRAPVERGTIGVVVRQGLRRLVLEVDDAPGLERGEVEALPMAWRGGWAAAAVRVDEGLIPLLDVDNLFERLMTATEST